MRKVLLFAVAAAMLGASPPTRAADAPEVGSTESASFVMGGADVLVVAKSIGLGATAVKGTFRVSRGSVTCLDSDAAVAFEPDGGFTALSNTCEFHVRGSWDSNPGNMSVAMGDFDRDGFSDVAAQRGVVVRDQCGNPSVCESVPGLSYKHAVNTKGAGAISYVARFLIADSTSDPVDVEVRTVAVPQYSQFQGKASLRVAYLNFTCKDDNASAVFSPDGSFSAASESCGIEASGVWDGDVSNVSPVAEDFDGDGGQDLGMQRGVEVAGSILDSSGTPQTFRQHRGRVFVIAVSH